MPPCFFPFSSVCVCVLACVRACVLVCGAQTTFHSCDSSPVLLIQPSVTGSRSKSYTTSHMLKGHIVTDASAFVVPRLLVFVRLSSPPSLCLSPHFF